MDKESITQYAWIIIIAIIMAALMVFATPFGDSLSESFVTLIKGQTNELDHAYSEEQIKDNKNYMEQLFDATHLQQGGLYKHNDASRCTYTWNKLQTEKVITIENGVILNSNYEEMKGDLIIDDAITQIGGKAFYSCKDLNLVRMGFGINFIGSNAFGNCTNLETFISGINVREISSVAFSNCENLKNVYLNEKITKIDTDAFTGCSSLKTIYYDGTMKQWNEITIGSNGIGNVTQIICSDGTIEI